MITITTLDEKYFLVDGIKYARIYQPLKQGSSSVSLVNIFDTKQKIFNSNQFNEIEIDSIIYETQDEAMSAILSVTWSNFGYELLDNYLDEIDLTFESNKVELNNNNRNGYIIRNESDLIDLISIVQNGTYVIVSDFSLTASRNIPENVTIEFRNAKINLGAFNLIGNKTKIKAGLYQIFNYNSTGVLSGSWETKELFAEWFGAVGDDINNDSLAIERAFIHDGVTVTYTKDLYLKTKITLAKNNCKLKSNKTAYTDPILFSQVDGDFTIDVEGYGTRIESIALQGNGEIYGLNATSNGVNFKSFDGNNVDSSIANSGISRMNICVSIKGRSCGVYRCGFSQALKGIEIISPVDGDSRAVRIENNRFHSMGTISDAALAISTDDECHSMVITNNYFDVIYAAFDGVLARSDFSNNKIILVYTDAIKINKSNNTIGALPVGNCSNNFIYAGAPSFSGDGIILNDCDDIKVSENTIVGMRYNGIKLLTATNCIIEGNYIVSPNFNRSTDGDIYGAINLNNNSENNLIHNNKTRSSVGGMRAFCVVGDVDNVFGINDVPSSIAMYANLTDNRDLSLFDVKRSGTTIETNSINVESEGADTFLTLNNNSINAANEVGILMKTKRTDDTEIELAKATARIVSSSLGVEKGKYVFSVMDDGVMTEKAEIKNNGAFYIYQSSWDEYPLILGTYYLWVDTSGRLRIKDGAPTSETDGTIVGLQS